MFGSDFPHPEGLADPVAYSAGLEAQNVPSDVVTRVMGGNLLELLEPQPTTA
jgi:hypothetical protein